MDRLWAPWRASYILKNAPSEGGRECFLCRGLASDADRDNLIVWRRRRSVVVLNRYPYNNGHLLVAPIAHQGLLTDFDGDDLLEPIATIRLCLSVLDRVLRPQGYNIGLNQGVAAGAGLPGHLHWHIVPRWDGDSNFMPILGDVKVIVESLEQFHDRFTAELARFEAESGPPRP